VRIKPRRDHPHKTLFAFSGLIADRYLLHNPLQSRHRVRHDSRRLFPHWAISCLSRTERDANTDACRYTARNAISHSAVTLLNHFGALWTRDTLYDRNAKPSNAGICVKRCLLWWTRKRRLPAAGAPLIMRSRAHDKTPVKRD